MLLHTHQKNQNIGRISYACTTTQIYKLLSPYSCSHQNSVSEFWDVYSVWITGSVWEWHKNWRNMFHFAYNELKNWRRKTDIMRTIWSTFAKAHRIILSYPNAFYFRLKKGHLLFVEVNWPGIVNIDSNVWMSAINLTNLCLVMACLKVIHIGGVLRLHTNKWMQIHWTAFSAHRLWISKML